MTEREYFFLLLGFFGAWVARSWFDRLYVRNLQVRLGTAERRVLHFIPYVPLKVTRNLLDQERGKKS